MNLVQAIALGVLQGIAEWLPVSSQGQTMVVSMHVFGISAEAALGYAIFLHVGTLVAATIYFRKEVLEMLQGKSQKTAKFVAFALLGTAVTAFPAYLFLKAAVASPFLLMLVIGIALVFTGMLQLKKKPAKASEGSPHGLLTGLAQGLSAIPGVSRSGITTAALLFQGFEPEKAFRLSFILSIPSVLVAELAFGLAEGISIGPEALVSVLAAAVAGYASIAVLLRLARKINFAFFCIAFGLLYLGLAFV